jgi:hypothetical protein
MVKPSGKEKLESEDENSAKVLPPKSDFVQVFFLPTTSATTYNSIESELESQFAQGKIW